MQSHDRFDTLGRLEDLPQDYRDNLTQQNLVPLWPSLRAVLPPKVPTRATQAIARVERWLHGGHHGWNAGECVHARLKRIVAIEQQRGPGLLHCDRFCRCSGGCNGRRHGLQRTLQCSELVGR